MLDKCAPYDVRRLVLWFTDRQANGRDRRWNGPSQQRTETLERIGLKAREPLGHGQKLVVGAGGWRASPLGENMHSVQEARTGLVGRPTLPGEEDHSHSR